MVGVSKFDWSGDRSTRDFASRNSREQRNGNGTDHASGQPRLGKHFLQHEQFGRLSSATLRPRGAQTAMTGKLFSANPARIGRFDAPPSNDAIPASLVDGTPADLKADLIALLGKENVLNKAIDLVRYASDASPYRLPPQA